MAAVALEPSREGMVREVMKRLIAEQQGKTNLHVPLAGQLITISKPYKTRCSTNWVAQPSYPYIENIDFRKFTWKVIHGLEDALPPKATGKVKHSFVIWAVWRWFEKQTDFIGTDKGQSVMKLTHIFTIWVFSSDTQCT
jgi:hypothetical protein